MPEIKIIVSEDGKELTGLYVDRLHWEQLGELQIERATEVKWDEKNQKWAVEVLDEQRTLDCMFSMRQDAINHEIEYLNSRL